MTFEAFEAVLEVRFRRVPGHRKIKRKEYALRSNMLNKDVEDSHAFNRCFFPGRRIDMSMIFDGESGASSSCPGCMNITEKSKEELDTQIQWSEQNPALLSKKLIFEAPDARCGTNVLSRLPRLNCNLQF